MNTYVLIAGIFALFTTIGHFTIGKKMYLKPMLISEFDLIPKKVMHSVFHYVSVFLITSTLSLLFYGFGVPAFAGEVLLIKFISFNYAAFAIWQIIIALTSGIPKSITKLFQWVFFILIAIFSLAGV
jgi:hypothetical protein